MGSYRRFRNSVGPQIKKVRKQQGVTQDQLASRLQVMGLDIDRKSVGKIETCLRSVFDFELLLIAKALKVSPEILFPPIKDIQKDLPFLRAGKIKV